MIRNAYTSTVLGPVQLGLGLLFATGVAVVAAGIGMSSWLAVLIAGVIVVTGVHLSVVRLSVGGGRVLIGQGPWNRLTRVIDADAIVTTGSLQLRWPNAFGAGPPFHRKTARLTVRAGPALYLQLESGEHHGSAPNESATACARKPGKGGASWSRSPQS